MSAHGTAAAPTAGAVEATTMAVQRCIDELADDSRAETRVRALLDRAVRRLHLICAGMLYRSYPRLTRPPMNLRPEEMLSAVVARLIRALRAIRPGNVRQFFAIANQHMRWELDNLAQELDERPPVEPLFDDVAAPVSGSAPPSAASQLVLQAIDGLPAEEREVFGLVHLQGFAHKEAAQVLGVSTKTVQRRLQRSKLLLVDALRDLHHPVPRAPL